jgi:hypothetical protein
MVKGHLHLPEKTKVELVWEMELEERITELPALLFLQRSE